MPFAPPAQYVRAPLVLVLTSLIFAALTLATPQPAEGMTNCNVADLTFDSSEQQFLTLINQYRAQHGLVALTVSENLNRAASWMANDMASRDYMGHIDSLGRGLTVRLPDCDTSYSSAAENVAAGMETAQAVFNGWRGSSTHNANMLGDYKQIGIARAYGPGTRYSWYWATEFSSVDDGTRPAGGNGFTRLADSASSQSAAAPAAPAAPAVPSKAAMTSPAPGSRFTAATMNFSWTGVPGASEYFLYVGTRRGGNDVFGRSQALVTSTSVSGLPDDGSMVYVRLYTRSGTSWSYNDYTYRALEPLLLDLGPDAGPDPVPLETLLE